MSQWLLHDRLRLKVNMNTQIFNRLSKFSTLGRNGLTAGLFIFGLCITTDSLAVKSVHAVSASESFQYQPVTTDKSQLSLIEAVQLALRNDPDIYIQKENSLFRKGEFQSESGRFDASLVTDVSGEFIQDELAPDVINTERQKRIAARTRLDALEDANTQFNEILGEDRQIPADGINDFVDTLIERDDQTRTSLNDPNAQLNQNELTTVVDLEDEVRVEGVPNDAEEKPDTLFELLSSEDESLARLTDDQVVDDGNEVREEPDTFLDTDQRTELLDFQQRLNILDTLIENESNADTRRALEAERASTVSNAQDSIQQSLEEFDQTLQDQRDEVEELGSTPRFNVDSGASLNIDRKSVV